jgi:hypothetical protein
MALSNELVFEISDIDTVGIECHACHAQVLLQIGNTSVGLQKCKFCEAAFSTDFTTAMGAFLNGCIELSKADQLTAQDQKKDQPAYVWLRVKVAARPQQT